MSKPAIGFVGLGAMGFGMATHLVKEGYAVHGYDVFPASIERFSAAGGIPAASLRASAEDKPFYVCMVASAPQVESVLFDSEDGIAQSLPRNATLLIMSTIPASTAQSLTERLHTTHNRPDIHVVDAPVSGGAKRAADGTLSIMAGGTTAALEAATPLLSTLSAPGKLYLVPGGIGAGSNMKMVHQVLAAIHILGASEVQGLAARLGLDAHATAERIIRGPGAAWTWMHENRSPRILGGESEWKPGVSAVTIILKDAGIITTSAREHHFPTPLCTTAEQIYLSALLQGYGSHDDAALVRQYFGGAVAEVDAAGLAAEEKEERTRLVLDLMEAVNLVAAAEAIAFARFLGVDLHQFYGLVREAAGGSRVFVTQGLEMIEGRVAEKAPAGAETVDALVARLEAAVQRARDLHCPLYLGNAALGVLSLARRAGLGAFSSTAVVGLYDGVLGKL
ncbi:putative oxidoreductase [Aspergillus homomorphus CBS 101889]|uniref:Putative oxidoreductase n=1 Tax=Aspergillus homomorphus (strain CBS 101889) TaxID=1450537 RepID=A0A395I4G2_ASPHC|nr:putative oxidoreductase [Aspergillus homomorphus CBS 101889]RAL14483.1 putative oxidoreductase [Aspergillus homomorphus CBS 101889]